MKAVILCGGQGTRIRDVSESLPKPMVPIGGKPILWHIMKTYSYYGVKEFILCLGYNGWKIKEYFLNYRTINNDFTVNAGDHGSVEFHDGVDEADWKVTLTDTGDEAMTGARLWKVRRYLEGEENFCLTYGDGVADIDVGKLVDLHKKQGKVGTITAVRPSGRFGEMILDGGIVSRFNEKPQSEEGWINGGFMVFDNKRVWDYFWPSDELILEREPLPSMVKDKELAVFQHKGFWTGMDTPREYHILNQMWKEGKAPWKIWG